MYNSNETLLKSLFLMPNLPINQKKINKHIEIIPIIIKSFNFLLFFFYLNPTRIFANIF